MAKQFNLARILAPVGNIVRRLKKRRHILMAEVELLDRKISRFGGGRQQRDKVVGAVRKGKRKRRSRVQLDEMAAGIIAFIKGKGKAGARGKEIKAKFGNLLPSVNAWLKTYSKLKVKTTGEKSTMRYFA
jgi:hypothetical protein